MPNSLDTDRQLLVRAAAGEEAAFAALYRRYAPRLASYFRSHGADPAIAADHCQQIFLRLLESPAFCDPAADHRPTIAPLLFTMARNLLNESFRTTTRRQAREQAFQQQLVSGPEASHQGPDRSELLKRLTVLPPPQRLCVELRFLRGYTIAEIAAALGCAEGTVKSRIHYGLQKLAHSLSDLYHD